jgi:hypothetical protein
MMALPASVFATERGGPFTPDAINRQLKRIGERAGIHFAVHAQLFLPGRYDVTEDARPVLDSRDKDFSRLFEVLPAYSRASICMPSRLHASTL